MDQVRKLQRALYRAAKGQPERRFTLLYDKVSRLDILQEAWQRVKANGGAAGVDGQSLAEVRQYGEERFLAETREQLRTGSYRAQAVRRVHIPKPGQPGRTRPLGIPTVRDRVVQMAVKLVIERRHRRRAEHWLGGVARREPRMFAHWHLLGLRPATG